MKITITTPDGPKEVSLPFYVKSEAHIYKVFSPSSALSVYLDGVSVSIGDVKVESRTNIGIVSITVAFCGRWKEVTAADFDKIYVSAYKELSAL